MFANISVKLLFAHAIPQDPSGILVFSVGGEAQLRMMNLILFSMLLILQLDIGLWYYCWEVMRFQAWGVIRAVRESMWLPSDVAVLPISSFTKATRAVESNEKKEKKPKGRDRPITLTSALYSSVTGILGFTVAEWQEEQEAFWDDAVRGRSALQAALRRRLLDELGVSEIGFSISGYCDIEKFYDSISLENLIHHAMGA